LLSSAAPLEKAPRQRGRPRRGPSSNALTLGALGVVFGDIGTSPLYAFRETLVAAGEPTDPVVLGTLSLIVWALMLAVSVKYLSIILRLDNGGEGGVLALAALLDLHRITRQKKRAFLLAIALAGAAMLFGDGVVTPAISILAAVEGLQIALPSLDRFVVPIACAIVAILFWAQRLGTEPIARLLGPLMLI